MKSKSASTQTETGPILASTSHCAPLPFDPPHATYIMNHKNLWRDPLVSCGKAPMNLVPLGNINHDTSPPVSYLIYKRQCVYPLAQPTNIDGGEHHPNFVVLRTMPAPEWEEHQGAKAALVSSGTIVLASRNKNDSPSPAVWKPKKLPPLTNFGTRSLHPQPNGWTTNPLTHTQRIPSSKGEHLRSPGSTSWNTLSAFGEIASNLDG